MSPADEGHPAQAGPWKVRLLGSFGVFLDGLEATPPAGVRPLVAQLATTRRPQDRATVARALWAELSEERRVANLRTALWRVRTLSPPLVTCAGPNIALAAAVQVDLEGVTDLARRLAAGEVPTAPVPVLVELSQDVLPGWDDEWVHAERDRHRHLRLHALERLSRSFSHRGDHALAVEAAFLAVSADPLRESARRALVEALLAEGNVADANRQFHQYRELVGRELGLAPSPELAALVFPRNG